MRQDFGKIIIMRNIIFFILFLLSASSVYAANVTVDASVMQGALSRYEQYDNIVYAVGSLDNENLKDLKLKEIRVFVQPSNWSLSEGVYDFSARYSRLDAIIAAAAAPVIQLGGTPQWLADTSYSNGVYSGSDPPKDYNKYQTMIKDGLEHYKTRYPNLEYIMPWNEPDATWNPATITPTIYYEIYKRTANAITQVNAMNLPGPTLKIGGPSVSNGSSLDAWMPGFLDYVKNNNIQIDFVDWHDYLHPNNPSGLKSDADKVRGWLSSRGMSKPIYIGEWNWQPGSYNWEVPQTASSRARTAAFIAVADYYWLQGGVAKPYHWLIRTADADEAKSQLGSSDGIVYPFYNTLKMMSMLKQTRVSAVSDGVASSGLGVGSIGTSDNTGIAVLLWNYQNQGSVSQDTIININNLPSIFSGKNIQYERYLVDATHSNYEYNSLKDKLELVESQTLSPRTSHSATINMAANSVSLIILTPTQSTTPNNPPAVNITSPINGSLFTAPANININATASDTDGTISKVEFFQNTVKLGEDIASPYNFNWNNVSSGSYQLTAHATDNSGAVSISSPITIIVNNQSSTSSINIINREIITSSDDAEDRYDGSINNLSGNTLELNIDHIGLRFTNIAIPQGVTINNAYMTFIAKATGTAPISTIYGEAIDNSTTFNSTAGSVKNIPKTNASISWTSPTWAINTIIDTPSINNIVQEIINRSGWQSGNAMTFIIPGTGISGTEGIYSYDSSIASGGGKAPKLHIEFSSQITPPDTISPAPPSGLQVQ